MKLETEIKETNHIKISDTDSLFIGLRPVLEHMKSQGIEINDTNKNEIILKLANQIQNESNANLNNISERLFNIKPDTHYFQLKQEVICAGVLTTGKRRYAMYVTNKEGVPVEELDMKGLELMKSNMNKLFKQFGEQFIKDILFGKPKDEIDNSIVEFYKSIKKLKPEQLGKPTGVKQIRSYQIPAKEGDMFSGFIKGAPVNTKAAIRYNDLLKFLNLNKKHESIIEGDKMYIINLIKNPYGIETIGMPLTKIPKEIEDFIQKYININEIFDSLLGEKLKSLYKDLSWDFPPLNPNVNKFFSFSN